MWRCILRMTVLTSVAIVIYSQNGNNGVQAGTDEFFEKAGSSVGLAKAKKDKDIKTQRASSVAESNIEAKLIRCEELYKEWKKRNKNKGGNAKISKKLKKCKEQFGVGPDSESNSSRRKKRSLIKTDRTPWEKCKIPYVYMGAYEDSISTTDIAFALNLYEKYSGFRFLQYPEGATFGDNTQWNLSHSSYGNFIDSSGCYSYVGQSTGGARDISACSKYTAVHEIGHLLGLGHEQELAKNIGYSLFQEQNIEPENLRLYVHTNSYDTYNFNSTLYDPGSVMHYKPWWYNQNESPTIKLYDAVEDDYLLYSNNWFYNIQDIQMYSGCLAFYDCSSAPTCVNGGYRSIVNNVCTCMCPKGLDPASGCSTIAIFDLQTVYPSGLYALLMPFGGTCPSGFSFGSTTQYAQDASVRHPSNSYQYLSPGYTDGKLLHDICTKTDSSGTGDWPAGQYCILREGGSCPPGFSEGYLQANGTQSVSENTGVLPDGEHDQIYEYYFCCRSDFYYQEEIDLPLADTFILYKSASGCQKVKDRHVVESYYTFKPTDGVYQSGTCPKLTISGSHYYTYYCVYFPLNNDNCGEIKALSSTDTEYTFLSPGFAGGSYPPRKNCFWHITSPEGTTMQLDFNEFEVSCQDGASCTSYIVVKNWQPGFRDGRKICGDGFKKTIWTKFNTLSVEFISGLDQESCKGFNMTVKLIQDNDKCYIGDGSGGNYLGSVNYSHDFTPCLPWNEVSHCVYNSFESLTFSDDLDSNYCRTTGHAPKPWCFVDAETCQTQTCDACMTGACYDEFTDCAALEAADSSFCSKNDFGEAHRGCMKHCNFCQNHAPKETVGSGNIACETPLAVTGVNMQPVKSSYAVGETVSYYCIVNGLSMTRTCTSEGTWTDLNLVCGICPEGWSVYNERCYKWLGLYEVYNYTQAQAVCESMQAKLPKLEDQGRSDYQKKLVHVESWDTGISWIGLRRDNDVWYWSDGTTLSWSNWDDDEPDNGEHCVKMMTDGTWKSIECDTSDVHYVVCELTPSDGGSVNACEDGSNECETFLANNPTVCEEHADFAWHKCRRSCARGVCATSIVCDDTVNLGSTGLRLYPASNQISQGNYMEYKCNSGFYHTSGDLKRICQTDGTFSGQAPVCSDAANTDRVLLYPNASLRRRSDYASDNYILTNDYMKVTVPGNIIEYHYFSNIEGTVAFVGLRETTTNMYEVLGKNVISSTPDDRKTKHQVPINEQFVVQVGDYIGLYHEDDELSYSECSESIMPQHGGWKKSSYKSNAGSITVSDQLSFSTLTSDPCRIYSVQAVVNPSA